VAWLDKEELKELLYLELVFTQQIEEVIARVKKAGRDLKAMGEALEKDPLLSPLSSSVNTCQDSKTVVSLLKDGGLFSLSAILADLAALKQQRGTLEDIQKRLQPYRNPRRS
jgi:hypothetical protein